MRSLSLTLVGLLFLSACAHKAATETQVDSAPAVKDLKSFHLGEATTEDASAKAGRKLTKADIEKMMKDLSNWGRWGKDDERGTTNFITPECVKAAAQLNRKMKAPVKAATPGKAPNPGKAAARASGNAGSKNPGPNAATHAAVASATTPRSHTLAPSSWTRRCQCWRITTVGSGSGTGAVAGC